MEQQRFDDLSRSLAEGLSRRQIVGALLGGLGALRLGAAEAACRQGGAGCSRDGQCCTGKCFKAAGVCSCTKTGKGRCKQPANRCRQTVCGDNGRCAPGANREQGFECAPSKGCDAAGHCVDYCRDGVTDGDESDIDCGGSCLPCLDKGQCDTNADCVGGLCCGGVCKTCPVGDVCFEGALQPECCTPKPFCVACADRDQPGNDGCGRIYDCKEDGGQVVCPPPVGKPLPNQDSDSQVCCGDGECPCAGQCCGDVKGDACFIEGTGEDATEFCCKARGEAEGKQYHVCNAVCCTAPCDPITGECTQTSGRLGSYRRGPIG